MSIAEQPAVEYANDDDVIGDIATPAERTLLAEFRDGITPHFATYLTPEEQKYNELTGDLRLLRFLRGYKGVVKDSVAAYVKTLTWYKQDKIGDIRRDIIARKLVLSTLTGSDTIHKQYFANVWHKEDREGSLLNYELTGRVIPKEFLKVISHDLFMTWQRYHMEFKMLKLTEMSHQRKRLVKALIVKDLDGLGLQHADQTILAILKNALQMATDNYPEMLETAVLINAPFIFNALWGIVRPWLQQQTLDKISIHGRTGYHDTFRKSFHVADLPVSLGGTCSCPGGCVKNVPGEFMVNGLQQVEIANGTAYDLPVVVPAGATLSWEFNVRAYDVKFLVKFTPEGGKSAVVVPEATVVTGKTIQGFYESTAQGVITLVWDNTYSFLRNKVVAYKVDLTAPPTASTDILSSQAASESGTLEAAHAALAAELAAANIKSN